MFSILGEQGLRLWLAEPSHQSYAGEKRWLNSSAVAEAVLEKLWKKASEQGSLKYLRSKEFEYIQDQRKLPKVIKAPQKLFTRCSSSQIIIHHQTQLSLTICQVMCQHSTLSLFIISKVTRILPLTIIHLGYELHINEIKAIFLLYVLERRYSYSFHMKNVP